MIGTNLLQLWRSNLGGEKWNLGEGVGGGGELTIELRVDVLHVKSRGDIATLLLPHLSRLGGWEGGGREEGRGEEGREEGRGGSIVHSRVPPRSMPPSYLAIPLL